MHDFLVDFISVLLYFVCILFVISAIDDLATDILYVFFKIFDKDDWNVSVEKLRAKEEKRIALFVPAWKESEVIADMVTHNLTNIEYQNYDFFVGVYPNDKETVKEVNRLERKYPRVYKSEVPHDGPTNKADCLNWIYQRMKLAEENENKSYDIIIMHDSEDIIHPLSFKLINYLMPEYQMVQIPVFSLEVPWNYFTAGTYCDEFAEHHIKNLAVRERVKGFIPSAGVGTAFSRIALDTIAKNKANLIFNTDSLTEDYEIGLKFAQFNFKQILVRRALKIKRDLKFFSFLPTFITDLFAYKYQFIATREYFPNKMKAAIRQKSRWILGIIFQGWEQIRWKAKGINRVFLYIDRKGIYSNVASFLGNILFIFGLIYLIIYHLFNLRYGLERFFPTSGFIWYLIIFNSFVMIERLMVKFYTSATLYGVRFAFLSILRIPWLNFINFFAFTRAFYRFAYYKSSGIRLTWDKTQHTFPSRDAMKVYRKRLGELLLDNRIISDLDLKKALSIQQKEGIRLGEILIRLDMISEESLIQLLSTQHNIKTVRHIEWDAGILSKVPADILGLFEAIPASLENDVLTLGVREPLEEETVENLEQVTGYEIQQKIIPNAEFYRLKEKIKLPVRLGMQLVFKGHLKGDDILEALAEQRQTGKPLGDILVKNGLISIENLSAELKETFGYALLTELSDYTEVEKVAPLPEGNTNMAGYVLKHNEGHLVYVTCKLPDDSLVDQLRKKYEKIAINLVLARDVDKWRKEQSF